MRNGSDMPRADEISRLRAILVAVAESGGTITYRELAAELGFEGPGVIRRVAGLLEASMTGDARAGRPLLAAVVVSRAEGAPRRGFFERAAELGRFRGDPAGPEAREFFENEHRAVLRHWRRR